VYQEATTEIFKEFDYSTGGDLVFTREKNQNKRIAVFIASENRFTIISDGFGATWSHHGERIVFTGALGLYVSDAEGNSIEKAIDLTAYYPVKDGAIVWDEWPPMAVWSPDSKYLLYHRVDGETYAIVRYELATGKETILYQGGMYPDWR
jgi:Tol biopolymer transport system component